MKDHRNVGTGYTRVGDTIRFRDGTSHYIDEDSKYRFELIVRLKQHEAVLKVWRPKVKEVA